MGCIPSKSKVLEADGADALAAPPGHTAEKKNAEPKTKTKTKTPKAKRGPPSPVLTGEQPPWLQARPKIVIETDGGVRYVDVEEQEKA